MITEIKTSKGIEGLVSKYTPQVVEEARDIEIVGDITGVMQSFLKHIDDPCPYSNFHKYLRQVNEVLTPSEIYSLVCPTEWTATEPSKREMRSEWISKLIENSNNAGYNNFILKGDNLALYLRGQEDKPIHVEIFGSNTVKKGFMSCFNRMIIFNSIVTVHGDAVFSEVENSMLTIYGEPFMSGSLRSIKSTITLHGEASYYLTEIDASDTVFKTSSKETLGKLCVNNKEMVTKDDGDLDIWREASDKPSRNKIIFIHPDGREEVVRDYS